MNELELYIHIPFCKKKCNYCDFVSYAGCEGQISSYADALVNEIKAKASQYRNRQITTIYIGGGTPSLLGTDQITKIVETLNKEFNIEGTHERRKGLFLQKKIRPITEFSIECNPGTVDREKLKTYRRLGINRLSMGLQSADNEDLKVLGRIHTFEDFVDSFEAAREAGFDNINVDLMQAIPGQTLMGWKRVLAMLCTFKPEHISAYSLIIEEGTEFKRLYDVGRLLLPDEDTERKIYHYTKEFLENTGYRRYEISNYAVPGYECRHNIGYWTRKDYLGLGLNASSMIDNIRWKNTAVLDRYLTAYTSLNLESDNADAEKIIEETEPVSRKDQIEEFMFLGLRMTDGVSREQYFEYFHQDMDILYGDEIGHLKALGLLEEHDSRLRLTDKGIDVSNTVLAGFLLDDEKTV